MLSNDKIKRVINEKEIAISITFEYEDNNLIQHEEEKDLLSSSLKDNLYSDRLKLTMGPIVKVLNKKHISPKHRFKSFRNYYDLRKSKNKYVINPGAFL